ncbi:hypothetical protein C8R42DRAFT_719595 [Lentinula raphanica]|nr:hypothetical protein C8R42DRAFT_719595 [Lentinula raphanica]
MHPLQPGIRPKLARSVLLCGALMLFLSFHDHFGGTPAIKGVLAAPMNRNQNIPPAQQAELHQLAHMDGITLAQLEMPLAHSQMQPATSPPPAQPVHHENQPFEVPLYLNRKDAAYNPRDDLHKRVLPKEKWVVQGGADYFAINQPASDSPNKQAGRYVPPVRRGPGLGGQSALSRPGMRIGTLTYPSESTAALEMNEFVDEVKQMAQADTNLLYLQNVLSRGEGKGRLVVDDDWYYLMASMLHAKGTGEGAAIPDNNAELQKVYSDMLEKMVHERSASDHRLLKFKQ